MSECYYCGCENDRFHDCQDKRDYHAVDVDSLNEEQKKFYYEQVNKQRERDFLRNQSEALALYDRILKNKDKNV